jgi:hypothetical protein
MVQIVAAPDLLSRDAQLIRPQVIADEKYSRLGLSRARFESCYCKIRAHPPRVTHLEERDDDKNSQRSRNSVNNDCNPGVCTSRGSRTWRECFLRESWRRWIGTGPDARAITPQFVRREGSQRLE